jgi:hypothetical protein
MGASMAARMAWRHHHGSFDDEIDRKVAGGAHVGHDLQDAYIGNQHAAQAQADAALDVLHGEDQLIGAAQREPQRFAGGGVCLRADIECGARADEQIDFDAGLASQVEHLRDLGVGHEHDPAALAYTMNGHIALLGLAQDGGQRARTFGGGNLDPVLSAIGKPLDRAGAIRGVVAR